jgi:cytochrome c oxidase subunit 2
MPPNAALHGLAVDHLMRWNLIALLACFAAAHLWLIFSIFKKNTAAIPSEAEESARTEAYRPRLASRKRSGGVTAQGLLLAALCAMYIWMAVAAQHLWAKNRFEGASPEAMQVEVVGQQFQWYFRYPGEDARFGVTQPALVNAAGGNPLGLDQRDPAGADDLVTSVLTLPVNHEVDIRIRSLDVIHGFFIPAMRLKENAVPGLILHVHFTPTAIGTYPILCSQVCGLGHQRMQAVLRVVSTTAYRDWLNTQEQRRQREAQEQEPAQ